MKDPIEVLNEIASATGGRINEVAALPDGSGFATMSLPLPTDHWLTANPDAPNIPPMPLRCGELNHVWIQTVDHAAGSSTPYSRGQLARMIEAAGRYAVRASTANGQESDFDPDAMIRNFIVGMLGYWSPTGFSSDGDYNPSATGAGRGDDL